jgi:glucose-6-phosphate isomerase, archaeal
MTENKISQKLDTIKLQSLSGLDMHWMPDGTLAFDAALFVDETAARPLHRLIPVALDPAACVPPGRTLYWMYNGIGPLAQRARVINSELRYELTLMFPDPVGRERSKTLGHYHAVYPKDKLGYPEIIEVLHGEGYFIFYNMDYRTARSDYTLVTHAKPGDKIIIPPNLYHGAIVAGDEPLLFADLLPMDINPVYQHVATIGGMSHLHMTDNSWIPNPRFARTGPLLMQDAAEYPELGLTRDMPLYSLFLKAPESLHWLREPDRFPEVAPAVWNQVKEHIVHERIESEPV